MQRTGAQIIVERLCVHGVDTVFGYPGNAVLPLYDELYQNAHRLTHIITAHEQGAAHAADGYARASGKVGVVMATSGPGATNLVTGIANAYLDSVPMVAITGNVSVPLLGKDSFQEVDIAGVTQPIVKHSFMVLNIAELEHMLDEAFRIAGSGRKGPVLIDVPKSIQTDVCEVLGRKPAPEAVPLSLPNLDRALEALRHSKRPYIYAGGGVIAGGAEEQLVSLSERLNAPVGLSLMGLTAMNSDHPLNLGLSGMHGFHAATAAQAECDVMLALGVRFSERAGGSEAFGADRVLIHLDIDLSEIGKNVPAQICLCGDVKETLAALLEQLPPQTNDEWRARVSELVGRSRADRSVSMPRRIIETVNAAFDPDTVVATDVGQHQMWTAQYYRFAKPRTLLTSGGLGAMGYGLGAAIGGCLATGRRTVLITSDGSFGMNLNELATAVTNRLPVVIVVLNNGVLGMVRQWQHLFFEKRYAQTTLHRQTDFVALARAFGADGARVTSPDELADALRALPENGPFVIDIPIDSDEMVFPMHSSGGGANELVTEAD